MHRAVLLALPLAIGLGCGTDDPPQDSTDAGTDAGAVDQGTDDAGAEDLGEPDSGSGLCDPIGTPLGAGIAPDARDDMAYAVDPACERVFMFFGDQGVPMACSFSSAVFASDVYVFDGQRDAWYSLSPDGEAPSPRDRASAVWDPARERVLVFGGRWRPGSSGAYQYPNDVWAYAPADNTWARLDDGSSAPEGRMDFILVGDDAGDRMVLTHGGRFTPDFTRFEVFDDTWSFDFESNTWAEITTSGTPAPASVYPSGALDTERGQLWVFSGGDENAFTQPPDLHMGVLDLGSGEWTNLVVDAGSWPEARINAPMLFDATRDRLVLFGGHDTSALGNDNDLYAFDLAARSWSKLKEGDVKDQDPIDNCNFPGNFVAADLESPERRAAHMFTPVNEGRAIMYGGNTDCGIANDTWSFDLATDTWTQLTVSPVGMTCPRTGNPNCQDPGTRICD